MLHFCYRTVFDSKWPCKSSLVLNLAFLVAYLTCSMKFTTLKRLAFTYTFHLNYSRPSYITTLSNGSLVWYNPVRLVHFDAIVIATVQRHLVIKYIRSRLRETKLGRCAKQRRIDLFGSVFTVFSFPVMIPVPVIIELFPVNPHHARPVF